MEIMAFILGMTAGAATGYVGFLLGVWVGARREHQRHMEALGRALGRVRNSRKKRPTFGKLR